MNHWQIILENQKRREKGEPPMAKDAEGNKIKKDKSCKEEKVKKGQIVEPEVAGKKKDKKTKTESVPEIKATIIDDTTIVGVSNAKIIKTLEDTAKLETTPAGDYFVNCPAGKIRLRKSEGAGKVSWQFNDSQISRPEIYKIVKLGAPKADPEETNDDEDGNQLPVDDKRLSATYKKKQLLNILKENQFFKKRVIKAVESEITEKKLTGSEFIAALDKAAGKETTIEKITAIFDAV